MRKPLAIVLMGATLTALVLIACSDDDPASPPASNNNSTPDSSIQTEASAEPYTLDDVCDRTAATVCEIRKPCCNKAIGYDEAACLTYAKADCAKDVASVRAGTATFFPERIDRCIPKLKSVLDKCTLTFDLIPSLGRELNGCEVFVGKKVVGDACERGSECAPSNDPDEFSSCDDDTKKCKVIKFLKQDTACAIGQDLNQICDDGLFCDVDRADAGVLLGTCKPKTGLGETCNTTKDPNLECNLGNYCNKTTGKCTAGHREATACEDNLECATVSCNVKNPNGPDAGKVCKPTTDLVKPAECGK